MATGTTTPARPASSGRSGPRDQFVLQQVNRARRHLRLIELGAALMALLAGLLAGLLALTVVDHWIWPLGTAGRWIALILMGLAAGLFIWRFIVPPLIHSINPLYAARAIEQSEASLKNSLVNFLFLRQHPEDVSGVVLETLGRTAATDLQRISVDASIDRTKLIRILYVLTAALALCAAYKVFSPKDPLPSVYRVLLPWTDVSAVSRVSIVEVEPGDTTGVLDDRIRVVARLRGTRPDDSVVMLCTSSDQQQVRRPIEMTVGGDGMTYEAELPPDGSGLKQDWTYRIQAGDALSREYRVTMAAKPLIAVQRLEYDFPAYTQRPRQVLDGQGDIEALEGTRVTLYAKANKPIRAAYVEWDPGDTTARGTASPVAPLDMTSSGTEASVQFVLRLGDDRRTPPYSRYQLRFVTEEGQPNVDPIVHRITIFPDLAPVVDILSPPRRPMEIPENGRLPIEVRALDPDFGLTSVKLVGSAGTNRTFARELLSESTIWRGQFVTKYDLVPRDLGFVAGDEIVYRAVARDNRHHHGGAAAPNEQRTPDYRVTIVAAQESPPAKDADDRSKPDQNDLQDPPSAEPRDTSADSTEPSEPAGEKSPQEKSPQDAVSERSEDSGGGEGGTDDPESGAAEPTDAQEGGQQGAGDPGSDESEASQDAGENGGQGGTSSEEGNEKAGPENGSSPSDGGESGRGEQGESAEGQPSGDGQGAQGSSANEGAARSEGEGGEARSPDDLHDGDIFDLVRRRLEESQRGEPRPDTAQDGAAGKEDDAGDTSSTKGPGSDDSSGETSAESDSMPPADSPAVPDSAVPDSAVPDSAVSDPSAAEGSPTERGRPAPPDLPQAPTERAPPGDNDGGSPDGRAQPDPRDKQPSPAAEGEGSEPGAGETSESGAGTRSDDPTGHGSSDAQSDNVDRNKTLDPDSRQEQEARDPPAVSTSDRQSDSQGDDASGDQSGGGGEGAGQSAKLPGADSAGTQEASDQGAGAADQSGDGETGSQGGQQQPGEASNGAPGTEAGEGSTSRPKPEGDSAGSGEFPDATTPPDPTRGDSAQPEPGDAGSATGGARQEGHAGQPSGGGIGTDAPPGGSRQPPPPMPEERANIDYADRATDLVLEHLRNQQQNPDQQLLDELGWSREDLIEFVRRWDRLKRAPATNSDARRELDESLRSLGLRPPEDAVRRGTMRQDAQRGNADDALRSAPPSRYFEQFNAFRKGAARSPDDGPSPNR